MRTDDEIDCLVRVKHRLELAGALSVGFYSVLGMLVMTKVLSGMLS